MDELLSVVTSAIDESKRAADELQARPSEQAAENACLECRNATQYFFLARGDFGTEIDDLAQPLVRALSSVRESLRQLIAKQPSPTLEHYLSNVLLRERIMSALLANDPAAVKKLLSEELAATDAS